VSVVDPAVQRAVTVSLSQAAGSLRCAASLTVEISPTASLTFRRLSVALSVAATEEGGEKYQS